MSKCKKKKGNFFIEVLKRKYYLGLIVLFIKVYYFGR